MNKLDEDTPVKWCKAADGSESTEAIEEEKLLEEEQKREEEMARFEKWRGRGKVDKYILKKRILDVLDFITKNTSWLYETICEELDIDYSIFHFWFNEDVLDNGINNRMILFIMAFHKDISEIERKEECDLKLKRACEECQKARFEMSNKIWVFYKEYYIRNYATIEHDEEKMRDIRARNEM